MRPRITSEGREVRDSEEEGEKGDSSQAEVSVSSMGLFEGEYGRA